jgi:hypothetical protein
VGKPQEIEIRDQKSEVRDQRSEYEKTEELLDMPEFKSDGSKKI